MLDALRLSRLGLGPKLVLAFVVVATLVAVTGAVGYTAVGTVDGQAHQIADDGRAMDTASEMAIVTEKQQQAVLRARLGEPGARESFQAHQARYAELERELTALGLTDEQTAQYETLRATHEEYVAVATAYFEARAAGNDAVAARRATELESLVAQVETDVEALAASTEADMEAQVAAADETTGTAQTELLALTVLAFLAAIAIGTFVTRRISPPIRQLSAAAVAASEGDLTASVDDHVEADEIGTMVDGFKRMQSNLRAVFAELETVASGLERGDLDRSIDTDYPGAYGAVLEGVAAGGDALTASFDEIQRASDGLRDGALDRQIDAEQPGQYGEALTALEDGTDQLEASFTQIRRASHGLRDGDLDQSVDTGYPGTYGVVLDALDGGIDRLDESLGTVRHVADAVADSSESVAHDTAEIEAGSQEAAESVEEISHGADRQHDHLQEVASEMNELSATVEEIAASAEEVTATATTAVERSELGQRHAAEATEELTAIEARADEATAHVERLDDEMAEISEVVELITTIAEQTNLLALNASIEAARAGEAGEGFAVVAGEIKSLAEDVSAATADVEARIGALQSTTTETVDGMESMRERVTHGTETIGDAIETFDAIAGAVSEAETGIEEISRATDDQAASAEEVVAMVDEVASVSQQTAAEASTVSAVTEEQTASLANVGESVHTLSSLATDLHDQVATFDLSDAAAGTDGPSAPAATGPERARADGGDDEQ